MILALVAVVALGAGGAAYATAKKQSGGAKQQQRSNRQQRQFRSFQGADRPPQFERGDRGDCPGGGPAFFSDAVVDYLGLSREQLFNRLRNGESLADIAKAQGKSVDGLKDVILDDATKHLNADVQAGRLTESQKNEILDHIRSDLDAIVNGQGPRFGRGGPPDFGPGGPPDGQLGPPGGSSGSGSFAPSGGSQGAAYFT
jgi:hypothetical protein